MTDRLPLLFLAMIPFLVAIVFHEMAHALIAKRYGDNTAEQLGRLTLNPVPHIDPIGTLAFPIIGILTGIPILGWAKPVPINYNQLKPFRSGLFFTAFAGPASNVIMAFLFAFAFVMMFKFMPKDFYLFDPLMGMAQIGIQINFALAIFNLIPIPPLDGSKMIQTFMSYETAARFEGIQRYGFMILMVLLLTGAFKLIFGPIIYLSNLSIAFWGLVFGV